MWVTMSRGRICASPQLATRNFGSQTETCYKSAHSRVRLTRKARSNHAAQMHRDLNKLCRCCINLNRNIAFL